MATALAVLGCVSLASAHPVSDRRLHDLTDRIASAPADAGLLVRRAELYREIGNHEAASADLRRAASISPGRVDVDIAWARLWLDAGQPEKAREVLDLTLARAPEDLAALTLRARALGSSGRPLDAAADLTRALAQCGPGRLPQPDLYLERARLLARAGDAHVEDALAGLEEGLTLLGPVAVLELEAIDLENRLGRPEAALARLDRLAASGTGTAVWSAKRKSLLEASGRQP